MLIVSFPSTTIILHQSLRQPDQSARTGHPTAQQKSGVSWWYSENYENSKPESHTGYWLHTNSTTGTQIPEETSVHMSVTYLTYKGEINSVIHFNLLRVIIFSIGVASHIWLWSPRLDLTCCHVAPHWCCLDTYMLTKFCVILVSPP